MKIEFNQNQYKKMIELLYMGQIVANISKMERDIESEELMKYMLSFFRDFDCDCMVEYDPDYEEYYMSGEFDDLIQTNLEEYDSYTFWNELAFRMASRDFEEKIDSNSRENLEETEIFDKISKYEEEYKDEFEKNGVLNLRVVR